MSIQLEWVMCFPKLNTCNINSSGMGDDVCSKLNTCNANSTGMGDEFPNYKAKYM